MGGTFVQPSETLCTHVHDLQVAIVVGLEGDALGRKVLGLPVSVAGVTVVVGTVEALAGVEAKIVSPVVVVGTSSGSSDATT